MNRQAGSRVGTPDGYKKFYLVFIETIKGVPTLDYQGMNTLPRVLQAQEGYVCLFEWPGKLIFDFTDDPAEDVEKIIEDVKLLISPNKN